MAETEIHRGGVRPPADFNPRTDPPLDFPDREFGEMTPDDYAALGFMAGLEVHQQLATRGKLFCRCPAGLRTTRVDAEVLRHMRPTLSELGEYDGTALMEFKTRKEIVYLLERGTVCTYEMDDTPPFEIDREAVGIALEICRLLNLDLVTELHVMRKQYLDGSIPTGFQRTAMMGVGGVIPFRVPDLGIDRDLRIRQLSLEEDSCREVSDVGHRIVFRTDRLGVPLTETVTEPEFLTPAELQAGARLVARVARATGKVLRGPGAARQDVNVSVAGGRRIEIKGVPHHRGLPRLVHVEAFRQLNLLRIREELRRRGVTPEMLPDPPQGFAWETSPLVAEVGSLLRRCAFRPVLDAIEEGETVVAVRLPGFAGLLARRTQPGITFSRELADRVRVIACLTGQPFLVHSDLGDYGLGSGPWNQVRKALRAGAEDALVVVWGPRRDADTAAREILIRAREALDGIPAETRQAFPDGTTGFERILPGPDRMYPDTDTPPVAIPDEWVAEISARLPETPWERQARYERMGLSPRAAWELAGAPWADLYDELKPREGEIARRLADALARRIPWAYRRGRLESVIDPSRGVAARSYPYRLPSAQRLAPLVRAVEAGEIEPDALDAALAELLDRPEADAVEILDGFRKRGDEDARLDEVVAEVAARAREELPGRPVEVRLRWAMGRAMASLRGRVPAATVRERLLAALAEETA